MTAIVTDPISSRGADDRPPGPTGTVRRVEGWRPPDGGAYRDQAASPPGRRSAHGPWRDADPSASRVPMQPPERPRSIRSAVALMYVGAGLTILSTVVLFATEGQLADAVAEAVPDVSRAAVEREVDRIEARALVRTAVGVGLWIWMAVKNGEGRRWARVLATVFGVINLISLGLGILVVTSLGADEGVGTVVGYTVPYFILGCVDGVVAVVILVLLYREDSSRYYDETARWDAAVTLYGR
jgi:hypothetical protein